MRAEEEGADWEAGDEARPRNGKASTFSRLLYYLKQLPCISFTHETSSIFPGYCHAYLGT